MKKIIAFDQDGTINITKMPIDSEMADLLAHLMEHFKVCVISGTSWDVMKINDIDTIQELNRPVNWGNYLIMPTTGMQFWHFTGKKALQNQNFIDGWEREYAYFLTDEQVNKTTILIEKVSRKLGYWCDEPVGEIIENRGSQVTFSALGQFASPDDKQSWDPDMKKRKAIVELMEPELEQLGLQVGIGGTTSIDITLPGIDKAYGMKRLMEQTGYSKSDILFIGDKLQPGGNDYSVKLSGIDTIEVKNAEETKWILRGILAVLK